MREPIRAAHSLLHERETRFGEFTSAWIHPDYALGSDRAMRRRSTCIIAKQLLTPEFLLALGFFTWGPGNEALQFQQVSFGFWRAIVDQASGGGKPRIP